MQPNAGPLTATLPPDALAALEAECRDGELSTHPWDLAAIAHDASHYLLQPAARVVARDTAHVARLLQVAHRRGVPVTFRSGGTSLSGQAGGEGLLVDTRRAFRDVRVLDGGARVRSGPGATVRHVNAALRRHGTRLGPDPASEAACTVGGVVANNSSGMTCGTERNAYRTLESLTFVLPSGTVVDTAEPDADARLAALEPRLWAGLGELRDSLRADAEAVERIRHQYSMKNTMGYGLNAFLDHDTPVEILSHLLVGSEGTLAFVGDVVLRTVAVQPHVATALLVLGSLPEATAAVEPLRAAGAETVELMDPASLRTIQGLAHDLPELARLEVDQHTALLVELQSATASGLEELRARASTALGALALTVPAAFTSDPVERAALWRLRKGLYTAVAGTRPEGSTALLEDVVVPPAALTTTTRRLVETLERHGYADAVIFGHALHGNLHFMITPRLDDAAEVARYAAFTEDLVDLVLAADGSLKAEHGTGRIMAPYVRRQFGDALHAVMRTVKDLCDPHGVLAPGVLLEDDPDAHLRHLKPSVSVDPAVDACVECGYCEPVCPSRDVTTTPRQRIVLMREIAGADAAGDAVRSAALRGRFGHDAVDTCAADSLCTLACPVGIDTGAVMKGHRAARRGPASQRAGRFVADHWGPTVTGLRSGLGVAAALPDAVLGTGSRAARAVLGDEWIPALGSDLPGPGPRRPAPDRPDDAVAVFFPACIDALFGPAADGTGATAAFLTLCRRAGVPVAVPDGIAGLCCGTPWRSKGLEDGFVSMARRTAAALWAASDAGRLPVVSEAASCSLGLVEIGAVLMGEELRRHRSLRVVDAVTFVRESVMPGLTVHDRLGSLAVHPTCSGEHLGATADLLALAGEVADAVTVPSSWSCCGFAGDRGMLHPELTAGATAQEAAELAGGAFDACASHNRPCEIGMARATGMPYRHVLELVEECTRGPGEVAPG